MKLDSIRVRDLAQGEGFTTAITKARGKVLRLHVIGSVLCELEYPNGEKMTKDLHGEVLVSVPYYVSRTPGRPDRFRRGG